MCQLPDPKRAKTDDTTSVTSAAVETGDPFELIYWPGFPGRGEFVRLAFEEAGVPYTDHARTPETVVPLILGSCSPDAPGDASNPPTFACPLLRHGSLFISQVANILLYVAPKLGLAPAGGPEVYHLNGVAMTLLDGFVNELHDTHHPVGVSLYYEDQRPEAKRRARNFMDERLPKFLSYAQRLFTAETSGAGPWIYQGELTYVDLVLFQCIDGVKFSFPKTMDKLEQSGKYDDVFRLYEEVKARPNVKRYLASDRRLPYSSGIWRHYPELEEE